MKMNLLSAIAFIGIGLVMEALQFLPGLNVVRELWLRIMGGVLLVIGSAVLAQAAWRRATPRVWIALDAIMPERGDAERPDAVPGESRVRA